MSISFFSVGWYMLPSVRFAGSGFTILVIQMGLSYGVMCFGIPPFLSMPLLNILKDIVLWDPPSFFLFRFQDLALSVAASAYSIYQRDWEGLKKLWQTQAVVGIISEVLKRTVRRMRPNGEDTKSFPSSHTSAAFTAAAYLHRRYGLKVGLPAYMLASGVGCVRVYKKAHYPSDVFAGASIAILTAYHLVNERSHPSSNVIDTRNEHGSQLLARHLSP